MEKVFRIVDMFSGAGGESTGILKAADALGMKVQMTAINHWERAIETHSHNYPDVEHFCESIERLDPTVVVPNGRVGLLWASPECTHHSNARGGRPRCDQSRASAWLILKWLSELYVDRVIVENVPEFLSWGPLGANGKPLQSKRGETFRAWVQALESLGYRVDHRILCAADFGAPTTRKRLFVQAVRGNRKIVWPQPSHAKESDMFAGNQWLPARDVIDWSIESRSIFDRKKPLADATLKRIEAGIQKFWGEWAEPFLVVLRGTSSYHLENSAQSLDRPLPAVATSPGHFALVSPFLTRFHGGDANRNHSVSEPVPTLDTSNRYGLIEPFIYTSGHRSSVRVSNIDAPLSTVVTKAEHCLIEPFLVQYYGKGGPRELAAPLDTVTCRDRFMLVEGVPCALDIRFRMLQPHELSAAQGFPENYWFSGSKADQVKQIGNAVPPPFAEALCREAFAS